MADFQFNIALGAVTEKVRDAASNLGVLLVSALEPDDAARDHADLAALLGAAGNTEVSDPSYSRKTGLTGTVTVDDANNESDVDVPDQTFSALAGPDPTDLIVFYDEGGTDATRVPLTNHDFPVTSDGSDVTAQFAASGFARTSG
jgi:hypothetical protein